uniref:A-type ATP synthase subunit I n=2 Tax=Thermofilum pendens TaxID=2269 RepID=A0A7C1T6H6_THEPE
MALTPEKLARFRIIVPSEHEAELLSALRIVANVHLEEPFQEGAALPELLVGVLEGKVTPGTLNMEEALSVARKVLRADDLLLQKMEKKYVEYEELQNYRVLAEQLAAAGVSLSSPGREFQGNLVDVALVAEERAGRAVGEFLRIGCSVRKLKLPGGDCALLLLYPTAIAEQVEKIKKAFCLPLDLPDWFFDSYENVKNKLDAEELKIKEEVLSILLDIASALRDAIEFEKISQEEVLENLLRAADDVRRELPRLESALLKTTSLHVAARAYKEGVKLLDELKFDKVVVSLARNLLGEEKVDYKLLKKAVGRENFTELLPLARDYNALLVAKQMASEAERIAKGEKTYYIICIDEELAESLKAELQVATGAKVVLEKEQNGFYGVLLEGEARTLENLVKSLRRKYGIISIRRGSEEAPEALREKVLEFINSKKTMLLVNIIYAYMLKSKNRLSEILEHLGEKDVNELWRLHSRLVAQPEQPAVEWSSRLEDVAAKAEDAVKLIRKIDTRLSLLSEVPLQELPEALSLVLNELKEALHKAHSVLQHSALIKSSLKVRSSMKTLRILRERRVVIVEGYIPVREKQKLEEAVYKIVPHVVYFEVTEVPRGERAPTYFEAKGLRKYLYKLTTLRGVPSYGEIDPTPLFTVLFVTMYGMMFGDVGQGLVLALFGAWLLKTRYRLLGISREGAASLGALALLAGISSMIFGALYGFSVFLKPLAHPLLSPIHDIYGMIAVAICFGVVQLMLAMLMNIVNLVRAGDVLGAIFSGMGGMGILFYSIGVIVGYHIVTSGFNLGVLSAPQLQPLTYILLASLLAVLGYGFFEWKEAKSSEKLMHAVSEVIEMIIALPANSMSYLRLAAFAMAHEVFGILAEYMGTMTGELAGYLVANFLVLIIEGLAVGIQAMRLVFYEFSSKFFKGGGIEFRPAFIAAQ